MAANTVRASGTYFQASKAKPNTISKTPSILRNPDEAYNPIGVVASSDIGGNSKNTSKLNNSKYKHE